MAHQDLLEAALPHDILALAAAGERVETPCGDGALNWRIWGSGAPLVLLHGGSGSWMHWARNIPRLARTYRVLAPDLPGLGLSALPDDPTDPRSFADALEAGLISIAGRGAAVDIVGFSFGSIAAGQLIGRPGLDIRRLVLVGPGALGVSKLNRELVKVRRLDGAARLAAHRTNLGILMFADEANIDPAAIAIQNWNSRHARVDTRPIARQTSLRIALENARIPYAAIIGEKDATSQPPLVCPVLRAIRPDVDIRILGGIGHWCAYEAPELFEATLADVFAQLA